MPMTRLRHCEYEQLGDGILHVKITTGKLLVQTDIDAWGAEMCSLVEEFGVQRILLDWSQVEYLASRALSKVLSLIHKLEGSRVNETQRLVAAGIKADVQEVLAITQISKCFRLFELLEDALAALRAEDTP